MLVIPYNYKTNFIATFLFIQSNLWVYYKLYVICIRMFAHIIYTNDPHHINLICDRCLFEAHAKINQRARMFQLND